MEVRPGLAPSLRNFRSIISDGTFVPLGGQHITAALWQLYALKRLAQLEDSDIEPFEQTVYCEVLAPETPYEIRQLASGQHQGIQSETGDTLSRSLHKVSKELNGIGIHSVF